MPADDRHSTYLHVDERRHEHQLLAYPVHNGPADATADTWLKAPKRSSTRVSSISRGLWSSSSSAAPFTTSDVGQLVGTHDRQADGGAVRTERPSPYRTGISWPRPDKTVEDVQAMVEDFVEAMQDAMAHLDGMTVRYEDLTHDPAGVTRKVCDLADVEWDPAMLDYGAHDHGPFVPEMGDFTADIRSGRVIPETTVVDPGSVPEALRPAARAWGYLPR